MNTYFHHHFGESHILDQIIDERLKLVNDGIMKLVRKHKELDAIKDVWFEVSYDPTEVYCVVTHTNGRFKTRFYEDWVNEGGITLTENKAKYFFGATRFFKVEQFFIDNGGTLPYRFLKEHEPKLSQQLELEFMLKKTPVNTVGEYLSENDLSYFLSALEDLESR